mgnify:CR=1 FL=1
MSDLLERRNKTYGEAWKLTGRMVKPVVGYLPPLIVNVPSMFIPWVMILNKLARILTTPRRVDHWRDIAGYATLVVESLTKTKSDVEKEDK